MAICKLTMSVIPYFITWFAPQDPNDGHPGLCHLLPKIQDLGGRGCKEDSLPGHCSAASLTHFPCHGGSASSCLQASLSINVCLSIHSSPLPWRTGLCNPLYCPPRNLSKLTSNDVCVNLFLFSSLIYRLIDAAARICERVLQPWEHSGGGSG